MKKAPISYKAAEEQVTLYLRRCRDIEKAVGYELEEREPFAISSCMGNSGGGGSGKVGNPTLDRLLRSIGPIPYAEIPDRVVGESYTKGGINKIRNRRVPGFLIKRPCVWLCFIQSQLELFEGLPEGTVLEEYWINGKSIHQVAELIQESKSKTESYVELVKGVAVGQAILAELV